MNSGSNLCPGKAIWKTDWLSHHDQQSGYPGLCPSRICPGKSTMVNLGEWQKREREEPRCDDPYFQSAFRGIDWAAWPHEYDGHHRCGVCGHLHVRILGRRTHLATGEESVSRLHDRGKHFCEDVRVQTVQWKKTPLVTNTQPDFSKVGNSELVDRTIRGGNWLRTDTIFIENEQIEALSNRPAWTAASIEVGISDGSAKSLHVDEGVTYSDNVVSRTRRMLGANYFSSGTGTGFPLRGLEKYYRLIRWRWTVCAKSMGYRVRPSWVWTYEERGEPGLIVGFVNDGIAGVPGVLAGDCGSEVGSGAVRGLSGCRVPTTGTSASSSISITQGYGVARAATESRARSKRTTLSCWVGVPAETEFGLQL